MRVVNTSGQEHSGIYCAYVRVSTDDQDVARQENEIKKWLNGGDHQIMWFKEEGVSGKISPYKRPELAKCIETARVNEATIIVSDIDRFSRRIQDTMDFFEEKLEKGKIKFVVCNEPEISESWERFSMKAYFGAMERRRIAERTRQGLDRIKRELKEKGTYKTRTGRNITKLGLHEHMDKARARAGEVVKAQSDGFAQIVAPTILALQKSGMSYREIAINLNQIGTTTARGGDWHASTVRNVIKRLERTNEK
jgi:DNA invertase Pin-like site-specific DNA recombinase